MVLWFRPNASLKKDSSNAMIQFAQAIGVLVLQEEETKGIRSKKIKYKKGVLKLWKH